MRAALIEVFLEGDASADPRCATISFGNLLFDAFVFESWTAERHSAGRGMKWTRMHPHGR